MNLATVLVHRMVLSLKDGDKMPAIIDDHDPSFEPYNSMSRERLAELMDQAFRVRDWRKWTMLSEYMDDKLTSGELMTGALAQQLVLLAINETEMPDSPEKLQSICFAAYAMAAAAVQGLPGNEKTRDSTD
jgi:hypothetical protein